MAGWVGLWLFICALDASCFVGWVLFMFACWLSGLLVALLLLVVGFGWCLMIWCIVAKVLFCLVWFGVSWFGVCGLWVVGFFAGLC